MARKAGLVRLLDKSEATLSIQISRLLSDRARGNMYLEEDYMDCGHEYGSPAVSAAPTYQPSSLDFQTDPSDSLGYSSDASLQSLNTVSSSSLVYIPNSPQLSSFIHRHPPNQQGHCYMVGEQSSYRLWEGTPSSVSRSDTASSRQCVQNKLSADTPPPKGALEPLPETRYCAVCSDYASGYHYGVWSCEGCKAFFKRSLQGHNDYMCPATNQCTIDRNRRKNCQACRLRKCCEVGMMKGGGLCKARQGRRQLRQKCLDVGRPSPRYYKPNSQQRVAPPLPTEAPPQRRPDKQKHSLRMPAEQFLLLLLHAEPPPLSTRQKHSPPYTDVAMMTLLTNLADKELVHMIAWAKKLPGFLDLSLHDQVQLLESSWLEVLMIGIIWRSVPSPGKLIFAQDFILDRSEGSCVEGMTEIFDMLLAMVSRFRSLQLKTEEFICLKAIILFNSSTFSYLSSSVESLHDGSAVQYVLDKIVDTLIYCIGKSGPPDHHQARRQARLLLLLSHIRHMSNKGMEHLHNAKRKNRVPLYDLLLEMLDAHRLRSPGRAEPTRAPPDTTPVSLSLQSSLNVSS
nr:estrogen receptor-like isoform X2 [Paramormyrops kingsleyae]